jgi:hypothetical protein
VTTDHPFDFAVPEPVEGQGRRPPTTDRRRDAMIEHRDATIERRDATIERRDATIERRDAMKPVGAKHLPDRCSSRCSCNARCTSPLCHSIRANASPLPTLSLPPPSPSPSSSHPHRHHRRHRHRHHHRTPSHLHPFTPSPLHPFTLSAAVYPLSARSCTHHTFLLYFPAGFGICPLVRGALPAGPPEDAP